MVATSLKETRFSYYGDGFGWKIPGLQHLKVTITQSDSDDTTSSSLIIIPSQLSHMQWFLSESRYQDVFV